MVQRHYANAREQGFALLIGTVIIGAVALSISIFLLMSGLQLSETGFAFQESSRARAYANACAEEALQQIRDAASYVGSDSLVFLQGSCSYVVTSQGGESRFIQSEGVADSSVRRAEIQVNAIQPSIQISSWQEVAEF